MQPFGATLAQQEQAALGEHPDVEQENGTADSGKEPICFQHIVAYAEHDADECDCGNEDRRDRRVKNGAVLAMEPNRDDEQRNAGNQLIGRAK